MLSVHITVLLSPLLSCGHISRSILHIALLVSTKLFVDKANLLCEYMLTVHNSKETKLSTFFLLKHFSE